MVWIKVDQGLVAGSYKHSYSDDGVYSMMLVAGAMISAFLYWTYYRIYLTGRKLH
jgi:hypothetical protein